MDSPLGRHNGPGLSLLPGDPTHPSYLPKFENNLNMRKESVMAHRLDKGCSFLIYTNGDSTHRTFHICSGIPSDAGCSCLTMQYDVSTLPRQVDGFEAA